MAPPAPHRPRTPGGGVAAFGIALLTTGVGYARAAAAEVEHVPLTWNAPASCPSAEAVLADIQRNLADSDPGAPFVAVVNVLGSKGGPWQANLRIEARGGFVDRRFVAESCEAIASAAALIIALSAESGAGASPAPPPPPPSKPESTVAVQHADDETVTRWRGNPLLVTVNGLVDGSTMPGTAALGLEAAVGPSWTASSWHLRLLAGAAIFPYHSVDEDFLQAVFRLGVVSGRGCVSADVRPLELGFCVGGELAVLHSSGTGERAPSSAETTTQPLLSPVGSVLASWSVSPRLAVFARGDVAVNGIRPTIHSWVSDTTELFTVPAATVRGALGIELGL